MIDFCLEELCSVYTCGVPLERMTATESFGLDLSWINIAVRQHSLDHSWAEGFRGSHHSWRAGTTARPQVLGSSMSATAGQPAQLTASPAHYGFPFLAQSSAQGCTNSLTMSHMATERKLSLP